MKYLVSILLATLIACGGSSGTPNDGGGNDGGGNGDGGPPFDAALPPGCSGPDLSKPQCSNCIDDDNDGYTDAFDIHCTGPLDNDEATFRTGIPGDNSDAVKQDCFFDGDSGAGNDGCDIHVCCLLGATTVAECPIGRNQYNPDRCPPPIGTTPLSQQCINFCGNLTPPGCDCFGCCTLCNPNNPSECYDIIANPVTSPECTVETLSDPSKCMRCTQVTDCGPSECGGSTCILCPGQSPDDLPAECNQTPQCPGGEPTCTTDASCPAGNYCDSSSQCCVGVIL